MMPEKPTKREIDDVFGNGYIEVRQNLIAEVREYQKMRDSVGSDDFDKAPIAGVIAPALFAVHDLFPHELDSALHDRMAELREDYENGVIGPNWHEHAYNVVEEAANQLLEASKRNPEKKDPFLSTYHRTLETEKKRVEKMHPITGYTSKVSQPILEEMGKALTWEEADSIVSGLFQTAQISPAARAALDPTGGTALLWQLKTDIFNEMTMFGHKPLNIGSAHEMMPEDRQRLLVSVSSVLTALEANDRGNHGFPDIYRSQKELYISSVYQQNPQGMRDSDHLSQLAEVQQERLGDIQNIYAKMQDERKGLHRDSLLYTDMMLKTKKVCDLAASYDPKDVRSVRQMQTAMDELFDAAELYSRKEVFGKSKSTSRGIERKNTAATLMTLTEKWMPDGGRIIIDQSRVTDLHTGRAQSAGSFMEMVEREKEKNQKKYGKRPEPPKPAPKAKRSWRQVDLSLEGGTDFYQPETKPVTEGSEAAPKPKKAAPKLNLSLDDDVPAGPPVKPQEADAVQVSTPKKTGRRMSVGQLQAMEPQTKQAETRKRSTSAPVRPSMRQKQQESPVKRSSAPALPG